MNTSRIRNTVLGIAAVALVGALLVSQGALPWTSSAQTTTVAADTPAIDVTRTITVVGKGTVTTQPDTAQATLGVETMGANVKEATSESSATMEAIIEALTGLGIAERDIQTSGFSIWSERNPDNEGRLSTDVTYRVMNSVNVKIRDLEQVGAVLDAAIDAGANSVYGVNFYLDDATKVESEAREKAVADARAKAAELADLTDVEIGAVVSISEVIGGSVPYSNFNAKEMASAGLGGGAGPINPGELDMTLTLQVTYAIK
ncbi:MAG: SIMPL domain-containing protein [Anaerolineae bacterium]|jgi:uncharacterized protein YggE